MKQENNSEMDLLLRKLGREGTSVGSGKEQSEPTIGEHLDVDELSAYAENVLPPATRLRYTEHLADCTRCRHLVSQLSLAGGLIVEERSASLPASSGIKAFLAGFFSPLVLRYAIPALSLIVVASISWMAFRQLRSNEAARSVSSNTVAQKTAEPAPPSSHNDGTVNSQREAVKSKSAADARAEANPQPSDATRSKAPASNSEKKSEEAKTDQPVTTNNQIAAAPAAAPAPAPAGNATPAVAKQAAAEPKERRAEDVADRKAQPTAGGSPAATATVSANDRELAKSGTKEEQRTFGGITGRRSPPAQIKNEAGTAQGRSVQGQEEQRGRDRSDKDDAETRSVAGRRFRREGSVWVDVAYDSTPTVNLSRGSDQYRALVADEPEIKTIADQLGGEVIVVWKGRAYRIR